MLGEWYRVGDFYISTFCKMNFRYDYHAMVNFRNDHYEVIIKEIKFLWAESKNTLCVKLFSSYNQNESFRTILNKCYPEQKNHNDSHKEIMIENMEDIRKLKSFISKINEKQSHIPQEIISEIESAFFYVKNKILKKILYKHSYLKNQTENKLSQEDKHNTKIPKKIIPQKPEYDIRLRSTFDYYPHNLNPNFKNKTLRQQEKEIATLCAQGLNPNALVVDYVDNKRNTLLLFHAIQAWHIGIIKILLAYGADPRLRVTYDDSNYESPLEHLFAVRKIPDLKEYIEIVINIIDSTSNKPRTSIDKTPTVKSIRTQNLQPLFNAIVTTFEFSDSKSFNSYLFRANFKLPNDSAKLPVFLDNLYRIFCKYFKFRDNKSYKAFKDNFDLNKYIDLLYEGNHLIGFYFYEMVFPEKKDYFIQYNAYSALKEEYRGYRISTLLGTRSAFSLQQIFPFLKGGIFFFAVSYNSFRQVEMLDPYPKFLTRGTEEFIEKNVLPHFLESEEKLVKDNAIMRFVEDESACDLATGDTTDPNKKLLFDEFILGLSKKNENKSDVWLSRSAPVFFSTTRSRLQKISNSLLKINVDFNDQIKELTNFFKNNEHKEEKKSSFLKSKL